MIRSQGNAKNMWKILWKQREDWHMICQGLLMCRRLFQLHSPLQSHKPKRQWAKEQLQSHLLRSACVGTWTVETHQKNTERIRRGRTNSITWMDRWHDRHESIIDICEYFEHHRITEKYLSAHGTDLISEAKSKSVNDCATGSFWSKHAVSLLFLSNWSIRCFDLKEMQRTCRRSCESMHEAMTKREIWSLTCGIRALNLRQKMTLNVPATLHADQ